MGLAPSGKAFGWITLRRMRALWWEFERQSPPVDENLLHTQARQIVLHRNAPGNTSNSNFSVKSRNLVVSRLSVVPLKIGKTTVNRGKRTGKRRLLAKSQHLTGRILLRTGTNTQEGDYPKMLACESVLHSFHLTMDHDG